MNLSFTQWLAERSLCTLSWCSSRRPTFAHSFLSARGFLEQDSFFLADLGELVGMDGGRNVSCPPHLFYANDLLIFFRETKSNVEIIHKVFDSYGMILGQRVNLDKSEVLLSKSIPLRRALALRFLTVMRLDSFPLVYLGVLNFQGAPKAKWLKATMDNILVKFDNWKGRTLFMAGRLALINSVIFASLLHTFMMYRWPSSLLKSIEKAIRNFLWTGSVSYKKLVTVKWGHCCKPISEGVASGVPRSSLVWPSIRELYSKLQATSQ
ncbi:uncharacterized protein LOC8282881 [Ricinus communis]|uniref:uncharacterized protein LOC8282881 n=1 Tax=Ricinus communis TaxID=3988 RepID=UPI00201AE024|nr:uncharacterized protein LOC8282881 [Ricinus communis]